MRDVFDIADKTKCIYKHVRVVLPIVLCDEPSALCTNRHSHNNIIA